MPRVKNIATSRPRFYHASFRDYLEDPSRSREYQIVKGTTAIDFFWGVFRFSQAMVSRALSFKDLNQRSIFILRFLSF